MTQDISPDTQPDPRLTVLNERRSTPVLALQTQAPDPEALAQIIAAATRVPDHGRLTPWRILEIPSERRESFAAAVQNCHRASDPDVTDAALEKDVQRFGNSPMLLVVISCIHKNHKVPEFEQTLSGACVCFALLQAAQALGFAGQWLTGWAAYDAGIARLLGLAENECVLGFMHFGTASQAVPERARPALSDIYDRWKA